MADHTDRKLTHHTLCRTELGSVDADFLYRASGASSFPFELRKSRGEERFTPALHGALHCSLHPRAARKARQINPIEVPKTVALREGWHDVEGGSDPILCRTVRHGCRGVAPALTGTSRPRFARLHTET